MQRAQAGKTDILSSPSHQVALRGPGPLSVVRVADQERGASPRVGEGVPCAQGAAGRGEVCRTSEVDGNPTAGPAAVVDVMPEIVQHPYLPGMASTSEKCTGTARK